MAGKQRTYDMEYKIQAVKLSKEIGGAKKLAVFLDPEIHRAVRVIPVFFVFDFLLIHGKLHVFLHSIEAIYPFQENVAVVTNANGANNRLEFNRSISERSYGGVFGTFFVCGLGEESFISLTPEQTATYKERFKKAETLVLMLGSMPVVVEEKARPKRCSGKPKHPPKPKKR